tara:strand:- start:645 stop:1403 length:759 start_codon:yes stop_codon:yes gene_type:complete
MSLAIGFTEKYYTLWSVRTDPVYIGDRLIGHDFQKSYIKNLSMDKEKAIEKAKKLGCVDLVPDPTLRGSRLITYFQETKSEKERRLKEQARKDELSRTTFTFGKYENKTYQEVSEIDSEYLHWAYNNSEANKVGIENTTYWKNKLAEEEKEKNALLDTIEEARKSGEIVLTILDNPDVYGICKTDKNIDIYFPEVKQNYYNGWEYFTPVIKGKGKRVKNKTFKVKIDKDWICDLFEFNDNSKILKVINIKKS